ncbi:MAG: hypothetical protein M1820_001674 [Bogoriella megaspora]|nr:MAG: hypothetical protein M1820_001674 [Bogoriella megaspora]
MSLPLDDPASVSWDFPQVRDLLDSLSVKKPPLSSHDEHEPPSLDELGATTDDVTSSDAPSPNLGNFSKIWEYLGAPQNAPVPVVNSDDVNDFTTLPGRVEYTSDGAIYHDQTNKGVKWSDQGDNRPPLQKPEDGGEIKTPAKPVKHTPNKTLSKKQKKAQKRNEKHKAEARQLARARTTSDADTDADGLLKKAGPARKASAHALRATQVDNPAKRHDLSSKAIAEEPATQSGAYQIQNPATPTSLPFGILEKMKVGEAYLNHNGSLSIDKSNITKQATTAATGHINSSFGVQSPNLIPHPHTGINANQHTPSQLPPLASPVNSRRSGAIQPLILRSGEDRNFALLFKLLRQFPQDAGHLVNPSNLINHRSDPRGIHVFIDASNIFIGFHDQLKRARGIPVYARVPRVDISFDSLALLLERRRPIAKRVLAGSNPIVPAFTVAENVGYELNILEKVQKAKELTSRQKYFMAKDLAKSLNSEQTRRDAKRAAQAVAAALNNQYAGSSSTAKVADYEVNNKAGADPNMSSDVDTGSPTHAPLKWVEQGVDEILHLKMTETILDQQIAKLPPSTIVLATGDAAEAEYSDGFMKQAERALECGWSVELCSWSRNISAQYYRREWRARWGEKFKIVELDGFAEELLEM